MMTKDSEVVRRVLWLVLWQDCAKISSLRLLIVEKLRGTGKRS